MKRLTCWETAPGPVSAPRWRSLQISHHPLETEAAGKELFLGEVGQPPKIKEDPRKIRQQQFKRHKWPTNEDFSVNSQQSLTFFKDSSQNYNPAMIVCSVIWSNHFYVICEEQFMVLGKSRKTTFQQTAKVQKIFLTIFSRTQKHCRRGQCCLPIWKAKYSEPFVLGSLKWLTLLSLSSSVLSHSKSLYRLRTQDSFSLKMGRFVCGHTRTHKRQTVTSTTFTCCFDFLRNCP